MPGWVETAWPYVSSALAIAISVLASGYAILHKRDVRAAIGWVGVIWLVPFLGAVLFALLGVNRIRRKAVELRAGRQRIEGIVARDSVPMQLRPVRDLPSSLPEHLRALARLVEQVTTRTLLGGNCITPLRNGDEAYPAMLETIERAERSITLSTYIFDNDRVGHRFVEALAAAKERGVEVRVLIDDAGARYSVPPITGLLRRRGVRVARFMPGWYKPWRAPFFNLRNHRKILVVDGRVGFTGGINIRDGHVLAESPKFPVADLHFKVEGPVVRHLQEIFADDWSFTTREKLEGEAWFPEIAPCGDTIARGIADGPDEDFEKVRWTFLGALACAKRSVRIVTPYFLPDQGLIQALGVAALKGVDVRIVLPSRGNLPIVQWAMWAQLWQVLIGGGRVWLTPEPFDHSKLMVVDDEWVLIGSANWDPRSLRLNFELGLECYDAHVGGFCTALVEQKIAAARELTLAEVDERPLATRLRDGVARLFTPYL